MRRSTGVVLLALLFALAAALDAWQLFVGFMGSADEHPAIAVFRLLSVVTAVAAAVGTWRLSRWAPAAAMVWTAVRVCFIIALGPLLALDPTARIGLWIAAAGVLVFGVLATRYVRRARAIG
ncbi:MAG TPA: hypothetical protein VFY16_03480 [Gemmatimonadaceae bacterium]|jgi:hypothetical protein|nr:hypothetical protein [Gemmatimonadaceae bacterium]